jgi:general L-amino acid transport system substrate-binding protein
MSQNGWRFTWRIKWLVLTLGLALACSPLQGMARESTISQIKQVNRVVCAVNVRAGLADVPTGTSWAGLSVDLTKALAAAILQDASKVVFEVADRKTGPEMIQSGATHLYLPIEPMAPTKLAASGLISSYPFFFNTQKILVWKDSGISAVNQLVHSQIAVQPGYVNEQNVEMANEEHLNSYFHRAGWQAMIFAIQEWGEMESAFISGHVKAVSAEETELARLRIANREKVGDAVMLPEIIGMEPVSAVVRGDDPGWLTLVNATISVLIKAEELGITSENIDSFKTSKDPEVQYLLGTTRGIGKAVELDDQWAERVIKAVGSYSQMFERDLGATSGLGIERGLNQTWRHGGLLYSMPIE